MTRLAAKPIVSALLGAALAGIVLAGAALAANTIRSIDIVNGSITSADLRNGDVRSVDIRDGNIIPADIRNGAVTSSKLATGSVTSESLATASVMSVDIADGSITTVDLADGAVTPAKLSPLDAWHVVGAAGQPAFEFGWGALPGLAISFRVDRDGMVHLLGTAYKAGCSSTPTTMFTLPEGYRPATFLAFPVITSTNPVGSDTFPGRVNVYPDGTVNLISSACVLAFLGDISFPVD